MILQINARDLRGIFLFLHTESCISIAEAKGLVILKETSRGSCTKKSLGIPFHVRNFQGRDGHDR